MKRKFTFIEWSFIWIVAYICLICSPLARALEFQADKNVAFNFTAPLVNSTNTSIFATGVNNTAFYVNSNDNTTFATSASNISYISGGIYIFPLSQSEMNHDRIGILYNGTGCLEQYFAINTAIKEAVDTTSGYASAANTTATSILEDTGTTLPASLGALSNVTLAATQTGVTIPTVTAVTNDVNITQSGADKVWGTVARTLTAIDEDSTTIDLNATIIGGLTTWDKTGYSIADSTSDSVIADAVWNAATGSYGTANTYGALIETDLDAAISTRSSHSAADVWNSTTRTLTAIDEDSTTLDLNSTYVGGVSVLDEDLTTIDLDSTTVTASVNATAVWTEDVSAYTTAGQAGTYLKSAASAGDPWSTDVTTGYNGQAGELMRKIYKNTKMGR